MKILPALLVCYPVLIGIAHADCPSDVMALRHILAFEPAALAKQNARSGDLRFFELHGLYNTVPGVGDPDCARSEQNSVVMQGTSTAACSKEHEALRARSHAFAQQYNEAMARLRTEKGLPSCGPR